MDDHVTLEPGRAFPRLAQGAHLRYRVLAAPEALLAGAGIPATALRNICGGGVRFHSPEPVLPGSFLAVELQVPGLDMAVQALGRVVRCEPPPVGEEHCEVAVEFLWTGWAAPRVQERLQALLARALEEEEA